MALSSKKNNQYVLCFLDIEKLIFNIKKHNPFCLKRIMLDMFLFSLGIPQLYQQFVRLLDYIFLTL